ncbi:MAG TPA: cysteine synthase family protein [Gemmatimonadales bacterium]|jgi:cysteine synthase A|nr:cysteine synthase family protein [Gemmatimonadales bacterium]
MSSSLQVLDAIGHTPLVEFRRVLPPGSARVVAKLESANPTGSMKDRVARAMVDQAAADGRLSPGGTVVEYTAGTTGVSLALICAARGYKAHFVFSDAFSEEKRKTMRAYGAELTDVKSDNKRITEPLIRGMIAKAAELSRRPGHWYCDQLNNRDGEAGYHALGDELWEQTGGRVDAFVQAVGTAHSIHGAAHSLRRHNARLHVTAVEPAESAVLSGQPSGSHQIEGIGIGFIPPLWRRDEVNEIIPVPTAEAKAMARRLAREEAVFAGTSTGANVVAALRVAQRLGPGATVATILVDSGLRYLSTDLFQT